MSVRATPALAGQAHQAAQALDQEVIARTSRVRSVLAEAGDGAVDQAGIHCLEALVIQAIGRESTHLEVFDQHVGLQSQLPNQRLASRRAQVDCEGPLVTVRALEVRSFLRFAAFLVLQPRRSPGARVVARARSLDLDDIRPKVAQQLRAPRSSQDTGEVEDPQPAQRPIGRLSLRGGIHRVRCSLRVPARP